MIVSSWVQVSFDAGHVPPEGACETAPESPHGHRYLIRVYSEGKYDPQRPPSVLAARVKLQQIREELAGQVIDQMLPAISTTPSGIAAWVLERIPFATSVEVRQDDDAAITVKR